MIAARRLLPLGTAFMLGACVSGPRPGPAVIVVPGSGKDFAAFRQDDTICRRHAVAKTGYDDHAPPRKEGSVNAAISGTPGGVGTTGSVGTTAGAPTGSGTPGAKASATAAPEPPDETIPDQLGYLQCMAAQGDTVRPQSSGYAEAANGYDYASPYDYGYPFGFSDGGFIGVFAGGFHGRDFHRRFFHGGAFHHGFFHRSDVHHGSFRGGGFHGGGGRR